MQNNLTYLPHLQPKRQVPTFFSFEVKNTQKFESGHLHKFAQVLYCVYVYHDACSRYITWFNMDSFLKRPRSRPLTQIPCSDIQCGTNNNGEMGKVRQVEKFKVSSYLVKICSNLCDGSMQMSRKHPVRDPITISQCFFFQKHSQDIWPCMVVQKHRQTCQDSLRESETEQLMNGP